MLQLAPSFDASMLQLAPSFLLFSLFAALSSAKVTRVRFDLAFLVNNATGSFWVDVDDQWAPLGAARFLELVDQQFFSLNGIFRCVPSFVDQWGISGSPAVSAKWANRTILDDPVLASNVAKTIAFATDGPNTRTTQLFVNLQNNSRLDHMGFAPFAQVVRGWSTVQQIYMGYAQLPDQDNITAFGNAYLQQNFPLLSYILRVVRA